VRKANRELVEAVEICLNRDLSQERIEYMFVNEVAFKMRMRDSVANVAVLKAIGVNMFEGD